MVALIASVLAVATPLRDGRENVIQHYERPEWRQSWILEGVDGSPPLLAAQRRELLRISGVTSVRALSTAPAVLGAVPLQVVTYDRIYDHDVVEGRAPERGRCEALVTRGIPHVEVGDAVTVDIEQPDAGTPRATARLTTRVVGVLAAGHPLVSDALVTTCDLTDHGIAPSALMVTSSRTTVIPTTLGASRVSDVARSNLRATAASGMLGLVTLLMALVALAVIASVGRWSARSRGSEFACLRVWGHSRATILLQVALEVVILCCAVAPIGLGLGQLLAWQFMRRMGDVVDETVGLWVAAPSIGTVVLVLGGLTVSLLTTTLLPAAVALRPSVASMLRRRGE